jgi:hypothetical protein
MANLILETVRLSGVVESCTAERLVMVYEVVNGGGGAVWLLNRLPALSGDGVVDPGRVYVNVEQPIAVTVSKKAEPVPPARRVEDPEVPYVVRLEPGERFEERLVLGFPLADDRPYLFDYPRTTDAGRLRFVRFHLGVLPDDPAIEFREDQDGAGVTWRRPDHGQAVFYQTVLRVRLPVGMGA